jgi:hypothetical protein
MPMGGNQFVATLDKARSFRKVVVTVAVGGKSASASFDLTANAHAAHTN